MNTTVLEKGNWLTSANAWFWLLWIAAIGLPLLLWLNHTGNPFDYLTYNAPAGQIPYLISKLCGLFAFSLLFTQIVLKFVARAGNLSAWKIRSHQWLGYAVLGFTVLHAGIFVTAKSIRGGHIALEALVPDFSKGYYENAVSLGVIALFLIILTVIVGLLRRNRVGNYWMKQAHKAGFFAIVLATIHCSRIGSEAF